MVTIVFQTEPNNADLQRLLDLARRFQLSFHISEEPKKTKADVLKDIEEAIDSGIKSNTLTRMELQKLIDLRLSHIDDTPKKTKADVLDDMEAAMFEVQQKRRNGQKGQSIASFLDEVESELLIENSTLSHAD